MNSVAKNIDCMLGMAEYPDKYFELAIVDPPYGIEDKISKGGGNHTKSSVRFHQRYSEKHKRWDISPTKEYFKELFRVSKNQVIFGGNYFELPPTRGFIIWDKPEMRIPTMSDCEFAWTSFDKPAKIVRVSRNGDKLFHPTQKPVKLYKEVVNLTAKQGDKILDTHLGSGSSRIACYDYGFDFTGFELDKDYFEAQEKRFKDHISQTNLFKPAI